MQIQILEDCNIWVNRPMYKLAQYLLKYQQCALEYWLPSCHLWTLPASVSICRRSSTSAHGAELCWVGKGVHYIGCDHVTQVIMQEEVHLLQLHRASANSATELDLDQHSGGEEWW